ncbi:ABC transporter substrate-binding protein [Companilactobacillus sp.]|jgi:multiple sugar transport system substrate-binding protein|uniref:ABC transporter substrate-binding protein n=1 Tax=Companilactobacillus sp. TaxID=2767905 RepID=UPI0025BBFA74|nr:sugar ABC transporter substrate-binding protein [Companilactobacillus sp.]MCH4008827.1 sugar ABC transporter substrate-binding protein [Companilactobacillus sp.]MCH4050994.1 sugar ABC transporter substrate-binding protein [Companilactobacillus sp.]MCH4076770.1 sugar ABC transporter substrate-binding protein [Companilactobacillus sp.]MCH4125345.1 sugar ABC transporter substrate-binding protein [Companilactobacillus sp.]MCH4131885.1 sugar ABC transporter substrate-binding protein [Companilact
MFGKWIKYGVFGLMFVILLSGCSKNSKNSQSDSNSEISVMVPDWGAPTQSMLNDFEKESGVKVNVQPTSWDDIKSKVSIASNGKQAPADVFEVDWSWVGEFEKANWLEKVDVSKGDIKDMPSLSTFKINGNYYAVPYSNDVRILYANKKMLSDAGVQETPDSWSAMDKDMKALKDKNVVKYPLQFPLRAEEKTTTSFITYAYLRNGVIFNKDNSLNKASALDTFKYIQNAVKSGYIDPDSVSTDGMDTFNGLNKGKGAFLIGPSSFTVSSNNKKVSKVVNQVEPLKIPSNDGSSQKTIAFTEAVGISKFSKNKKAAAKFVKWYSTPKVQKQLNKNLNNIPTRTSVLQQLVDNKTIKNGSILVDSNKIVAMPFPNGVPDNYAKLSSAIFNTVNKVGRQKMTPEQATNHLAKEINKINKDK